MPDLYDFDLADDRADVRGAVVLLVTLPGPGPTSQDEGVDLLAATFPALRVVGIAMDEAAAGGHEVSFPVVGPVAVSGPDLHPLFAWLNEALPGPFGTPAVVGYTKYLVGRDARPLARFEPTADARDLITAVQQALATAAPDPRLPVPTPPRTRVDEIIDAEIVEESSTAIVRIRQQVTMTRLSDELADSPERPVGADLLDLAADLAVIEGEAAAGDDRA